VTGIDAFHQSEWYGYLTVDEGGGWQRLISTDTGFPIAVSYPRELGAWLDRSRREWLKIEIGNELILDREDLRAAAIGGDAEAAMVLHKVSLAPVRVIAQISRQAERQTYLGMRPADATVPKFEVRSRGVLGGADTLVPVFEVASRTDPNDVTLGFVAEGGLFALARRLGSAVTPAVFGRIADSITWQGRQMRRRIELQQQARAQVHGAGDPMSMLRRRLSQRLEPLRARPGDAVAVLGVRVAFDPADLPGKPAHWPTSGHFLVVRSDGTTNAFGSEGLAAAQVIDEAIRRRGSGWTVTDALVEALVE